MRELREDTFSGNKNKDAHDHIDRVFSIIGLFNIPGVTKDAVMLRVFPFTLTGAVKKWVDRLALGTINTWDLLKKAFIQGYCPPFMTTKQLEDIHNFKQEGPIPKMTPAQALTTFQTMADHSQKWHDGTTSRDIRSSSSKDGLAALVNKLDNLGRDMKKLKERPPRYYTKIDNRPPYGEKRQSLEELLAKHQEESARRSTEMEVWIKKLQENADINIRNQSASLKNLETQIKQLTKEIHSNKTLSSSLEQIKTITADHETSGLNKLHGVSLISKPKSKTPKVLQHELPPKELNPGSFTLPCTIGKFNFYAMADLGRPFLATIHAKIDVFAGKISLGIDDDRLSFDIMRKDHNPSEKIFMVNSGLINRPQSPAQSNNQNDYEESGNWDNRSPNLDDREPKKRKINKNVPKAYFCDPIKQNIKEQTKMWSSCDPDKKYVMGGVDICRVSKNGNLRFWYCNYDNERRNIKGKGLSFPDFLLAKYGKSQTSDLVWDNRYAEWCDVGHTDISEPVKKALLKLWLIDYFQDNSDIVNNPTHKSFDDYKWKFNLEIDKLVDEYELRTGKKGHILDNIWEYCNQVHNKNYEWHNYEFENKECEEIGIEDKDYHPPKVQVETFEVKKYSFEGGQSFVCVSKNLDNVLPLRRKNGSKFKEMIRKEVENNKT
ncbi:phospholipase-like protein [Tanacetum coccineum]|uniref:Phospholipase-like protein n=1 Tax=Tanacetum coccineum TaxID=301880 RepID=A0ABQ4Z525_9ASTR